MTQGETAEGGINLTVGNRLKLIYESKLHPFECHIVQYFSCLRDQRLGQLIKAAAQETHPEHCSLSSSLTLALLKRLL
jgi:hypothetical protein